MSIVIRVALWLVVGLALLLVVGEMFGVISLYTSVSVSFTELSAHVWDNYRHVSMVVLTNLTICYALAAQLDMVGRRGYRAWAMPSLMTTCLLLVLVLIQGGWPSRIVSLGQFLAFIGPFLVAVICVVLTLSTISDKDAYFHHALRSATLVSYLMLCAPALNTTFILAAIVSVSIMCYVHWFDTFDAYRPEKVAK